MNPGQAHRLVSRAPTLDQWNLWSRNHQIQEVCSSGIHLNLRSSNLEILLYC
jgi:hypothetical protein